MVVRPIPVRFKIVDAVARADRTDICTKGTDSAVVAQVGNLVHAQLVEPIPMTANSRILLKSTNFDHITLAWC